MFKLPQTALIGVSLIALSTAVHAQSTDLPQASSQWFIDGQATIKTMLAREANTNTAKNIIVIVADGNGVGTNYALRLFDGQQKGMMGEENVLPYETPDYHSALIKTYNINAQTPDSALTAGAMNTGVKQRFNLINLGENAVHDDCATIAGNELTLFSEMMTEMDKSVGVVSTARITHATPAAVYAKTANRNWEDSVPEGCTAQVDIAQQLVNAMEAGTVDFAMGGGASYFLPADMEMAGFTGSRADGLDLMARATELGAQTATDTASFEALDLASDAPVLALYEDSHMQYEVDRADTDEPSLVDMTRSAIEYLSKNENGYYLEIEAGRIDHANHDGNAYRTLSDGVAFAEAVALADELTSDEDTLIIVTSDHEHAISFNGYCGRGSDILGLCMDVSQTGIEHTGEPLLAADGKPYTVIGYLNGTGSVLIEQTQESTEAAVTEAAEPSAATPDAAGTPEVETVPVYSGARPDLTQEQALDVDYIQQALIPMESETHSGEDVAVYAKGPWAHLFDGTLEQNVIFHVMNHAVTAQ
ncbi:alkaline phosphatase [Loktanella fryxellensis]|uniref:Alkaline phosphatase n=1 Tax=Loktanella fryxellensis TaxID=245187 RepID=A0A1H7ZLJ1_9RHOB|nr:alkaline phosphatase [Loktanella fryxellensis]SEM59133.1 alkaline phosphatase [Loktanella fryxellensis]